jgi:hypothetical protein
VPICLALFMAAEDAPAATEDLGHGFFLRGVATSVSSHRGLVAIRDGHGKDCVLVWLMDHRGGYGLLMIDAATGQAEEFPVPAGTGSDSPFASILSAGNKFYSARRSMSLTVKR